MKRLSLAGLLLLMGWLGQLLSLSGCASLSRVGGVSVSVTNVLPTQASLFETSAALTLRLTNETPEPILLVGGAHRLYLNGSYVGRAVSNERITLPQLGTATQTVTVYMENLTLVRKMAELSNAAAPRINYKLESRLHAAEGQRGGDITTTSAGELDLSGLVNTIAPAPGQRNL